MSKTLLWSTTVFVVFAFATLILFFWIREGSLEGAGAQMHEQLHRAGERISAAANSPTDSASSAVERASDGDNAT
jgi:hypothetical protein